MPILFLIFCLFFTSCKPKENSLSSPKNFPLESRNFMTQEYAEGESLIRQKILNIITHHALKENISEEQQIKEGDEFIVSNKKSEIALEKENDFKHSQVWMTKLIVSYLNHMEVYFLPDGLLIHEIINRLNLKADMDREFRWVPNSQSKTQKGSTLYLISLNREDLILNDQNFFEDTINLSDEMLNKEIILSKYQKIKISAHSEYFINTGVVREFAGIFSVKCTRDMNEAGMCGGCKYKRVVDGGVYEKNQTRDLNYLGFKMNIDEDVIAPEDFKWSEKNEGDFVYEFNQTEKDLAKISISKISTPPRTRESRSFDLKVNCKDKHGSNVEYFSTKSKIELNVKILGRGDKIKNIIY